MSRTIVRAAVTAAATGALLIGGSAAAFANDCANVSRSTSPTPGGSTLSTPFGDFQTKGRWVNLGDVWVFISPGTQSLLDGAIDTSGMPGAQGSFTGANGDDALLATQAAHGGGACDRSTFGQHGIAGACGAE